MRTPIIISHIPRPTPSLYPASVVLVTARHAVTGRAGQRATLVLIAAKDAGSRHSCAMYARHDA